MALVFIPSLMRSVTAGKDRVEVPGKNLREIVENLEKEFPGIKPMLVSGSEINEGVALAVDGEPTEIGLMMEVGENSEVQILPAIAGG